MAENNTGLPPGFKLVDTPETNTGLPPGFKLVDSPEPTTDLPPGFKMVEPTTTQQEDSLAPIRHLVRGATSTAHSLGKAVETAVGGPEALKKLGLAPVDEGLIGQFIKPIADKPSNAADFVGGLVDPALMAVGGATSSLFTPAKEAINIVRQSAKIGAASGAASSVAAVGAAQLASGNLDAVELAKGAILGAGAGALGGAISGKSIKKSLAKKAAQNAADRTDTVTAVIGSADNQVNPTPKVQAEAQKIQEVYGTKVKEPTVLGAVEAQAAKTAQEALDRTAQRIEDLKVALADPNISAGEALKIQNKLNKAQRKYSEQLAIFKNNAQKPAFQVLNKAKEEFGDATVVINGKKVPIYKQSITKQGVVISPEEVNLLKNAADITPSEASSIGSVDQLRLFQKADNNQANGPIRQLLFEPAEKAIMATKQFTNELLSGFRGKIKEFGIDTSKARQRVLFRAAEGRLSPQEQATLTEAEHAFINHTKALYADLLKQINEKRALLGYSPVKARKDYVTHIKEWSFMDELGLGVEAGEGIQIANKFTKKLKAPFRFERARVGGKTEENLINAFEAYAPAAARQIKTLETGALLHGRAKFLPPNLQKSAVQWINSAVMGGLDVKDAELIEKGLGGLLNVASKISGVASRGTILGNISVLLQQPSQMLATVRQAGLLPMLKGHIQAFTKPPEALKNASSFLTLRNIDDDLINVDSNILKTPLELGKKILEFSDSYFAKASWYAGFNKAQKLGLSTELAIKYADDTARMLHSNYNAIYKPALLRGKSGVGALPLQTFVFNAWNHLTRDSKILAELKDTSTLRQVALTLGTYWATNQVYEAVGLPAPFGLKLPNEASPEAAINSVTESLLGLNPVTKIIQQGSTSPGLNQLYEELHGGSKSILKNSMRAVFTDDPDIRAEAVSNLRRAGGIYVPFGLQAVKTIEGIEAIQNGYYKVGSEEVELKPEERTRALIFGPKSTPSARKVREEQALKKTAEILGRERD